MTHLVLSRIGGRMPLVSSMKLIRVAIAWVAFGMSLAVTTKPVFAQVGANAGPDSGDSLEAIVQRAKGPDESDAQLAAAQAERLVTKEPWRYRRPAKPVVEALLASKRYEQAERLARAIILGAPSDWWLVNNMQGYRVQAYLAQSKNTDALAAVKGLYNYSHFRQTAQAIEEVARVLEAVDPEHGSAKARRFRIQQQVWASNAPKAEGEELGQPVLADVSIDVTCYQSFFERPPHRDPFVNAMNHGLVLLLADQPGESLELFRQAESFAETDTQRQDVVGAIARALRARDQCMAAANEYLSKTAADRRDP